MLHGFTHPLSPLGKASAAGQPPWHFAGDIIALEFWTKAEAAEATLPPGLSPDPQSNGRVVALFADWQFTGQCDELLEPARHQFHEFHMLVDAHWKGTSVSWIPYAYVDSDSAMALGWILGFPARLGSIFQTRNFAAPGPATAMIEPGTKFGVSLSACGQRLANGRLTLRQPLANGYAALVRPVVNRRYFPSVVAGNSDKPAVDQLVMAVTDDLTIIDVWSGDAELTFPTAIGEELHTLCPTRMGTGYRFSMSCSISNVTALQDLTK
jgi:Acetoacetate decarboxylase (ADC)